MLVIQDLTISRVLDTKAMESIAGGMLKKRSSVANTLTAKDSETIYQQYLVAMAPKWIL